jgi:hypothetical protein
MLAGNIPVIAAVITAAPASAFQRRRAADNKPAAVRTAAVRGGKLCFQFICKNGHGVFSILIQSTEQGPADTRSAAF